jgi:hypothetical protein
MPHPSIAYTHKLSRPPRAGLFTNNLRVSQCSLKWTTTATNNMATKMSDTKDSRPTAANFIKEEARATVRHTNLSLSTNRTSTRLHCITTKIKARHMQEGRQLSTISSRIRAATHQSLNSSITRLFLTRTTTTVRHTIRSHRPPITMEASSTSQSSNITTQTTLRAPAASPTGRHLRVSTQI